MHWTQLVLPRADCQNFRNITSQLLNRHHLRLNYINLQRNNFLKTEDSSLSNYFTIICTLEVNYIYCFYITKIYNII